MYKLYNTVKKFVTGGGKQNYRSDIDGLRAIACLGVVIFHAFPNRLPVGFVGVDIFFVISGFLISSIIYRNLLNEEHLGKLFIVDFYIRRIKRIFPALISVLIFCLITGYLILFQPEFKLLCKHIFGGSVYISNFLLYSESGNYFDNDTRTKPLLNLWSLGVEEQFYLIFPLVLWLIYKSNLNFILCLIIFTAVSFVLNINEIKHNSQSASFYLPWCRFWELSIGAILSYIVFYHQKATNFVKQILIKYHFIGIVSRILFREPTKENNNNLVINIISFTGFTILISCFWLIKNSSNFPGYKAILPITGAILIISAGKEAFLNKYILSNELMVFFGLISYPLYLWHWPILSFLQITEGDTNAVVRIFAVLLSIALATITFIFIEPPLRYGKFSGIKSLCLLIVLLIIGCYSYKISNSEIKTYGDTLASEQNQFFIQTYRIWNKNEFEERFKGVNDTETREIVKNLWNKVELCKKEYPAWNSDTQCYLERDNNNVSFVLFGDSHAGNLLFGLEKEAMKNKIKYNSFQNSMSVPFYGFMSSTHYPNIDWRIKTSDLMFEAFNNEVKKDNIEIFVLAHAPDASFSDITDKLDPATNNKTPEERWRIGMNRTIDFLTKHNKKVLFILDSPALPFPPASCLKRPISIVGNFCKFDKSISQPTALYNKLVKEFAVTNDMVEYIDLADALCDKNTCNGIKNGYVLYADAGHTNLKGSEYLGKYVYDKIIQMLNK